MGEGFHCFELLMLQRLQNNRKLWDFLKIRLFNHKDWGFHTIIPEIMEHAKPETKSDPTSLHETETFRPLDLWFLAVTLEKAGERFVEFVRQQYITEKEEENLPCSSIGLSQPQQSLLQIYLSTYNFTELHLDNAFNYLTTVPREIFFCCQLKVLSLKHNCLSFIPSDIGRLNKLETLYLTNNQLENKSIPYTLTFCTNLRELYLDNNLLDALPGFVLEMKSLETVHRHGNHNYFKATFMWYHTDVNERILEQRGDSTCFQWPTRITNPDSLQYLSAKAVIASKIDFFTSSMLATCLKDYISDMYYRFNVCGNCKGTKLSTQPGYKVFTFKNSYLGNTCVPFQHWACSYNCAEAVEIPARVEQILAAAKQDLEYECYVQACQRTITCIPTPSKPSHCHIL